MTSSRKPPLSPPPAQKPNLEAGDLERHPRPSGRRVVILAFLASALFHLIVIMIYPVLMDQRIPDHVLPGTPTPEAPTATERLLVLLELIEVAEEAAQEAEAEPEVADAPAQEVAAPPVTPRPADEDPEEEERRTAAERLRPQMGDPRLWREVEAGLTEEERARIRVYGLLREWGDSIAALEEAERRALDWTYTDDEGRRWGISPGRIHLGEFSLPLPIHFTTPPGLRDEVERRAWEWSEIERGAASAAVREALQERAREIRTRRDAERADTLNLRR